jgi:hypothetical protein
MATTREVTLGVARELAHYDQEPMAIPSSRILLRGHERVTRAARRSALGPSGSVRPMRMTFAAPSRSRQRAWGDARVCGRGRRVFLGAVALMLAGVLGSCGSTAAAPDPFSVSQTLRFRVVAKTTQKLDSVVWTGQQFLYVQNTANTVWAAPPAGRPLHRFATMPRLVEETRCVLSVGRHGFPSGAIFCHSPDNKIYEISADGSRETVFATLPAHYPPAADGALAFDTVGRFGYRLLAATGRSGGTKPAGGQVDAVDSHGRVQRVGRYAGPGGADELVIAPRRFGSVGGDALLTVDAGGGGGRVVAVDSRGRTRAIAIMPMGLSPIAAIPTVPSGTARTTRAPVPGLYLTDDKTGDTYIAPAAALARYAGDVIVGTESPRARFWILAPRGKGFADTPLQNNLAAGTSLEQAIFVS